jgi:ABC-type multidrug transport system ATPase subunit
VNRLPESDFVVVLDKGGKLIEQGTYSDLRSGHGYVHNLDISNHDEHDGQDQTEVKNESENEKPDTKVQTQEEETAEVPSDRSVFMYYFNSNGLHNMILQALLIASAGVLTAFRCERLTPRN